MAIGIDRATHKKLITGLLELSVAGEKAAHWKAVMDDLEQAYEETIQMLHLVELKASIYNEVQSAIRTQVATEFRNRKKRARSVNHDCFKL